MRYNLIKFIVVSGNIFVIISIMYCRLTEMFASSPVQLVGYSILAGLLAINTFLLMKNKQGITKI